MIDMLTVLVFFLLVYSTEEVEVLPSAKDVQLPESIAEAQIHDAVVVIVTEQRHPDQRQVGRHESTSPRERRRDHPRASRPRSRVEASGMLRHGGLTEEEKIADREVTIMADKELPYQLLRKVMATSTAARLRAAVARGPAEGLRPRGRRVARN